MSTNEQTEIKKAEDAYVFAIQQYQELVRPFLMLEQAYKDMEIKRHKYLKLIGKENKIPTDCSFECCKN